MVRPRKGLFQSYWNYPKINFTAKPEKVEQATGLLSSNKLQFEQIQVGSSPVKPMYGLEQVPEHKIIYLV